MKKNIVDITINIIIILAFILAIYWFIQLLFGYSPALSEFNSVLIVMVIGLFVKLDREVGEIKVGIKHSFIKVKGDIGSVKNDLGSVKNDLGLIKKKLKI